MSAAQQHAASRLIRDIHELAESVRVDHVPDTGRLIPQLGAADLYRILPRLFRRAMLLADLVGTPLTRWDKATLRAMANLIDESIPPAAGYCEHCGSNPECVICGRGIG